MFKYAERIEKALGGVLGFNCNSITKYWMRIMDRVIPIVSGSEFFVNPIFHQFRSTNGALSTF